MSGVVTTSWGAPVSDNKNSLTAGAGGPIVLSDLHLIDKIAHFDRERIPERVVHAKGAGAHGKGGHRSCGGSRQSGVGGPAGGFAPAVGSGAGPAAGGVASAGGFTLSKNITSWRDGPMGCFLKPMSAAAASDGVNGTRLVKTTRKFGGIRFDKKKAHRREPGIDG